MLNHYGIFARVSHCPKLSQSDSFYIWMDVIQHNITVNRRYYFEQFAFLKKSRAKQGDEETLESKIRDCIEKLLKLTNTDERQGYDQERHVLPVIF